jgi:hypothetical protein
MLRAVPEVLAGSYLVGYDTVLYAGRIASVPSCLEIARIGTSQLLPLMLCPLGKMIGPVLVMKIAPILMYALLGAALSYFAARSLRLLPAESVYVSSFVLLQTATLRVSWDLHRNLFATALLLILLSTLSLPASRRNTIAAFLLSMLIAVSHELVATLTILIVSSLLVLVRRPFVENARCLLVLVSMSVVTVVWVFRPATEAGVLFADYGRPDLVAVSQAHVFAVLLLPLIPFALMSRDRNRWLFAWLGFSAGIAAFPLIGLPFAPAFWDRWMLMLAFPLSIIAALGALRLRGPIRDYLKDLSRSAKSLRWMGVLVTLLTLLPFAILAVGFMSAPSDRPFPPFDDPILWHAGWSGIPSTMQSNTVSFRMIPDVENSLDWLSARMNSSDVLLTHDAFYGYALLSLPDSANVLWYGYGDVGWGVSRAKSFGFVQAYLIWFAPGSGWHGPDPDLANFKAVFQSGMIVVYVANLR